MIDIDKHVAEFLEAVHGGRGTLDAWLECNNEAECRAAIIGAIEKEREACAKVCEMAVQRDASSWLVAKGFACIIREQL